MLAGLISTAARGIKGGAEAYSMAAKSELDKKQKVDLSKQLSDMEEQKAMRVDKYRRDQDLAYLPKTAVATAQADVAGQVAGATALQASNLYQLKAQNQVTAAEAPNKYGVNLAEAEALKKKLLANVGNVDLKAQQEATATAKAFVGAASVPGYYAALSKKALAEEGSSQRASAALANFNLATAKGLELIKKELITARANKDDAGVLAAEQKLATMQGGVKSYADVIKAAGIYESMAKDVIDPMKNGNLDEKVAQQQAALFRDAAVGLLESVSAKRGVGGKKGEPETGNPGDINAFSKDSKPDPAAVPVGERPVGPNLGLLNGAREVKAFSPGQINERGMLLAETDPAVQRENLIKSDPVLNDLQKQKGAALKAGKTAKANALIAEYNRLVKEKYGE
tara:strand:+ start:5235 stop:6425 length:1191 start_codon:yes stop_codon:yes gene_type:complete